MCQQADDGVDAERPDEETAQYAWLRPDVVAEE